MATTACCWCAFAPRDRCGDLRRAHAGFFGELTHDGSAAVFTPRRLATLVRDLLDRGPPPDPLDAGV